MTPAEKLAIRASLMPYYQHRCTIQRQTVTGQDGYGDDLFTWTDLVIEQPCRYWERLAPGEQMTPPRNTVTHLYQMLLPSGTDVTEADRITNVTDVDGEVIQSGPLNITEVLPYELSTMLALEKTT